MNGYETIETIWYQLDRYQNVVHKVDHSWLEPEAKMRLLREYALALTVEVTELLQHFPWKPWVYAKTTSLDNINYSEVAREWADCLVFLFDMALAIGLLPEDLDNAFKHVMVKNWSRQEQKTEETL